MTLNVGKRVVYPCQGPCLIGSIEKKIVNDRPMMFYQLFVLGDGGGKLFVPVDKIQALGIRPLIKKIEVTKLLDHLKRRSQSADDYRQRARDNIKLFASGSAFDLAEIVESLTELSETKSLSLGERKTLERAKRLLVCEISEVLRGTKEEAEQQIDKALSARKDKHKL
ncbi:MAG TPA: CarD family transcriptional regulator [Blastocatellia bacterium]|nr:CarD family transcriptional regulator [Blastocatellia bacterium]